MDQRIPTIFTFLIRIPLISIKTPNHYSAHYIDHNKVWDMLKNEQTYTDSYLVEEDSGLELKIYIDVPKDVDGDLSFAEIYDHHLPDFPFSKEELLVLLHKEKYFDSNREIKIKITSIILDI